MTNSFRIVFFSTPLVDKNYLVTASKSTGGSDNSTFMLISGTFTLTRYDMEGNVVFNFNGTPVHNVDGSYVEDALIDGDFATATVGYISGMYLDTNGDVYIIDGIDGSDTAIRRITFTSPTTGTITTLGSAPQIKDPHTLLSEIGIVKDSDFIYTSDFNYDVIWATPIVGGARTKFTGNKYALPLRYPMGMTNDDSGTIYVADDNLNSILKIYSDDGTISTFKHDPSLLSDVFSLTSDGSNVFAYASNDADSDQTWGIMKLTTDGVMTPLVAEGTLPNQNYAFQVINYNSGLVYSVANNFQAEDASSNLVFAYDSTTGALSKTITLHSPTTEQKYGAVGILIGSRRLMMSRLNIAADPYYTITISPSVQSVSFNEIGNQSPNPVTFNVTINHFNGHNAPITISCPANHNGPDGWSGTIDGLDLSNRSNDIVTIPNAPDSFDIVWGGTGQGWSETLPCFKTGFYLTGTDANGIVFQSNTVSMDMNWYVPPPPPALRTDATITLGQTLNLTVDTNSGPGLEISQGHTHVCSVKFTGNVGNSINVTMLGNTLTNPYFDIVKYDNTLLGQSGSSAALTNWTLPYTGDYYFECTTEGGSLGSFSLHVETYVAPPPVTPSLTRLDHAAVLLPSGKVLLAGGYDGNSNGQDSGSACIYDPTTETCRTLTHGMNTPRSKFNGFVLSTGKVLLYGNWASSQYLTLDIFDPIAETFTDPGLSISGWDHSDLFELPNGLIALGIFSDGGNNHLKFYNLITNTVTDGPALAGTGATTYSGSTSNRTNCAIKLDNGKILYTCLNGYFYQHSQLYDPSNNTFTEIAPPVDNTTLYRSAIKASDSSVIIGGGNGNTTNFERFDPTTNTFAAFATSLYPLRMHPAMVQLPAPYQDKILVAASASDSSAHSNEILSISGAIFTEPSEMLQIRQSCTATLLNNGKILIAGGYVSNIYANPLHSCELYDPATGTFTATGDLK